MREIEVETEIEINRGGDKTSEIKRYRERERWDIDRKRVTFTERSYKRKI